jgi:hypothetical protein
MGGVFGASSTTDEVLAGMNLRGKRIFVTGVSAGLGVETKSARRMTAPPALLMPHRPLRPSHPKSICRPRPSNPFSWCPLFGWFCVSSLD